MALQLGRPLVLAICAPVAVLAFAADAVRGKSQVFEEWIQTCFGFMMRESERAIDGRVVVNGATWVVFSFLVLLLLFPLQMATASFFIFIIGDAFAALVGRRFGAHPWPGSSRTREGTAAFIVTGLVAALVFPGLGVVRAVPAVLLGAVAEVLPGPLNDNVRVPVVIGLTLFVVATFAP